MGIGNKLLHPKIRSKIGHTVSKNLKNIICPIEKIKNYNNISYIPVRYSTDKKEEFICEIKNGFVFSSWGFVFVKDKILLDEVLPYKQLLKFYGEIGGRFVSYLFNHKKKLKGNSFSLQSVANTCFYHWIYETLPKLFLLKDSGLFDKIDNIILGDGCNSHFHTDSLKLLKADNKNIVYISDETKIICENLLVASFPAHKFVTIPPLWVRYKYKQLAKSLYEKIHLNKELYEKVYISRNKAATRKTINEEDIMKVIKHLGYKLIYLEDYSLEEQICIFYYAKKIISPHGSGLTNIIFCKENQTSILDIIPSIRYESIYSDIGNSIGLTCFEYIENNENNFLYYGNTNKENDFDIIVDINSLLPYIKKLEE